MLTSENLAELAAGICATAETLGQTISATAARLMAEDLSVFPPNVIRAALQSCRRELTGKFTLGAVMQRIQAEDGRPGKDEAWSIAVQASDEFETVVLTDEIQLALIAAKPILDTGDKVGARMAFNSAYERLVGQAREDAKPASWHVSVGFDAGRRIQAVTKAVELQRIPREHGQKYLADLSVEPITEEGRAIAGLLTGEVTRPEPALRKKLQGVKESMLAMRKANEERKLEIRIEAANELADRRALLIKQAQELEQRT